MIEEFSAVAAKQRLNDVTAFVQGAIQPSVAEEEASLDAFVSKLSSAVDTANAAVAASAETKQDKILRAQLTYAAALFRDCKYALMGRGRLQELGVHNMFREAYEVGRAAKTIEFAI